MTIEITDFESLLLAAKNQAEPQRLLFVFLKVSLPNDHNSEEAARFHARQGGQLYRQLAAIAYPALEILNSPFSPSPPLLNLQFVHKPQKNPNLQTKSRQHNKKADKKPT